MNSINRNKKRRVPFWDTRTFGGGEDDFTGHLLVRLSRVHPQRPLHPV